MLDIVQLKSSQKLMISYDERIYEGKILKTLPQFFLVSVFAPNSQDIHKVSNGKSIAFSVEVNNDLICCTSKVIGVKISESEVILVFSNPNIEKKVERRNYVRVPLYSRTNYLMIPSYLEFDSIEDIPNRFRNLSSMTKTEALDISVGGMRILTTLEYKEGDIAVLQTKLDNMEIMLTARVVRVEYVKAFKYKTAFQFYKISEEQRQAISNYVFKYIESTS